MQTLARRFVDALAVTVADLTPARQRFRIAALPARSVAVRRPDGQTVGRSGAARTSDTGFAISP